MQMTREKGRVRDVDEEAYRRKIEAAYGMKVAIKRFLDDCGEDGNHQYRRRTKALREAMEAYCNA